MTIQNLLHYGESLLLDQMGMPVKKSDVAFDKNIKTSLRAVFESLKGSTDGKIGEHRISELWTFVLRGIVDEGRGRIFWCLEKRLQDLRQQRDVLWAHELYGVDVEKDTPSDETDSDL